MPEKDKSYQVDNTIRNDIPFPEDVRPRQDRPGRPDKYPWLVLNVGDSFLLPPEMPKQVAYPTVSMANARFRKSYRLGKTELREFRAKKTDEGIRVWRVK